MSLYYNGNLEEDLKVIETIPESELLDQLGQKLGYGRCQQILQILWAKDLENRGIPVSGALFR